jgi:phage terminase large subunit-like protein
VRAQVSAGRARRVALLAPTQGDARAVMIEGPSGLLAIGPPDERPRYQPSLHKVTWPGGAVALVYSADEPERLRGPQHDAAWVDELCAFRYPQYAWDMLMFGLRLGSDPRCLVTTTPRPIPTLKRLLETPGVVVTRGSTYENAQHLAPGFLADILARYQGTRLGRQEIEAELLADTPGALWRRDQIEAARVQTPPTLKRVVVALDPALPGGEESAETGIVAVGLGVDGHGYVLGDLTLRASPAVWASRAVAAYHDYEADRLVAEVNSGGDMIEHTLRTVEPRLSFRQVRATRGKLTRAEPVAALYEQGKIHHVGAFPALEDQLTTWIPGEPSPDRLDALVWALTDLMLAPPPASLDFDQPARQSPHTLFADASEEGGSRWRRF